MIKGTIENFIISILFHIAVIIGIYFMVQPDPKGIGFWFYSMIYGVLLMITGVVCIFRLAPDRFIYQFTMLGMLIYVYWVYQIATHIHKYSFLDGIVLLGLFICLVLWVEFVVAIFRRKT